jgi:hypothetical protein
MYRTGRRLRSLGPGLAGGQDERRRTVSSGFADDRQSCARHLRPGRAALFTRTLASFETVHRRGEW